MFLLFLQCNMLTHAEMASDLITYLDLPQGMECVCRRLSFYLAMEEYVAQALPQAEGCLFLWQVAPTVIVGRNQVLENEVNLPYCREHGIDIVRRKSGGGAVYADRDNVMFSLVLNRGHDTTPQIFSRCLQRIIDMLQSLGVEACSSDHNDIMIGNRKVSGWAVYQMQERIIVHGTMLFDTNMQHMVSSITPSSEKLARKGVESVRQRICLLKDFVGDSISVSGFRDYARRFLCGDRTYVLAGEDVKSIEARQSVYDKM